MINYIDKDVTTVTDAIVVHGVNCQGAFGSGVAGAIRKKWVDVFVQYMNDPIGKDRLGHARWIYVPDGNLYVVNAYTQEFYGSDGKRYADPAAIDTALSVVFSEAEFLKHDVYMPKIGCGLGGLDWETEVRPIVEKYGTLYENKINIFVCTWGN